MQKWLSWKVFSFLGLLAVHSAAAQVYWTLDFDSPSTYLGPFAFGYYTNVTMNVQILDVGPPYKNVCSLQADCSNQAQSFWTVGVSFVPTVKPEVVYDPDHTFLKFDVLASMGRPVHLRLEYVGTSWDTRDLEGDVSLSATNTFSSFLLPLKELNTTYFSGSPPNFPTTVEFSISGNPTNSTSWPPLTNNTFMVDNISYVVSPPLSIAAQGGIVVASWPTNTPGFVLQLTSDLTTWQTVINSPVLTNGMNEVALSPGAPWSLYRLIGP